MFCPNCGKENNDSVQFCGFCGTQLKQQVTMQTGAVPPPIPEKKKSHVGLILGILALVIVLLGGAAVAGVMLLKGNFDFNFGSNSHADEIASYLERAEEYRDEEKYKKAIAQYVGVLDLDPDNEEALTGLTECYELWAYQLLGEGDGQGAIDVLDNADERASRDNFDSIYEEAELVLASIPQDWTDSDLIFSGPENVNVPVGYSFITRESGTYLTEYAINDTESYPGVYGTSRGLDLGMSYEDFLSLYNVKEGYAAWELYSEGYTYFANYEVTDDPYDLYYDYDNAWLDLGFAKVDGVWVMLEDMEVRDIWFCEADYDDYDEVMIFGVNVDAYSEVIGLTIDHFTYDESWSDWQGWADGSDTDTTESTDTDDWIGDASGNVTYSIPGGFTLTSDEDGMKTYNSDAEDDFAYINVASRTQTFDKDMTAEIFEANVEEVMAEYLGYEVDIELWQFYYVEWNGYPTLITDYTYELGGVYVEQIQFAIEVEDLTTTFTYAMGSEYDWTDEFTSSMATITPIN